MKSWIALCLAGILTCLPGSDATGTTARYVAQDGQPPDPVGGFTSWGGAATAATAFVSMQLVLPPG